MCQVLIPTLYSIWKVKNLVFQRYLTIENSLLWLSVRWELQQLHREFKFLHLCIIKWVQGENKKNAALTSLSLFVDKRKKITPQTAIRFLITV